MVKLGEIEVQWVDKTYQLADPLAKYGASEVHLVDVLYLWTTLIWNDNENLYIEFNDYVYILWRKWCINLIKQPLHFVSNLQMDRRPSLDTTDFPLIFCRVSQLLKEKTISMLLLWMNVVVTNY